MRPMAKHLRTIDELIAALGGVTEVAKWAGVGKTAVSNWSARELIPPGWHLRLFAEAKARGYSVDPVVFGWTHDEAKVVAAE